jgi:hypothetical protein
MKTHLNLLSQETQRAQLARLRIRQWSVVWLLSAGVLTVLAGVEWRRTQLAQQRREAAEEHYAPIRKLQQSNRELAERIEVLQKRESLALSLSNERPLLALLGIVGRASQAAEGRVCVQQLQWSETRRDPHTGEIAMPAALRLDGFGLDYLSIARFAAALRDVNLFAHVQVNASNSDDKDSRSYSIECAF